MKNYILAIVFIFWGLNVFAQNENLFEKKEFKAKNSVTLPYRIIYPENYNPAKKYPLLVFLHGAGERGNDNEQQLRHGVDFLMQCRKQYPAIVVVPQCPANDYWANVQRPANGVFTFGAEKKPTKAMESLMALVKEITSLKSVDKKHVYIGGISMGGMGTFEILYRMPKTFAAAFPICGGGDPLQAKKYAKNTSLWIFHGAKDDVVPVHFSQVMYKALQDAGASVFYTEYPEDKHNSWDSVFKEEQLMRWLFSR